MAIIVVQAQIYYLRSERHTAKRMWEGNRRTVNAKHPIPGTSCPRKRSVVHRAVGPLLQHVHVLSDGFPHNQLHRPRDAVFRGVPPSGQAERAGSKLDWHLQCCGVEAGRGGAGRRV